MIWILAAIILLTNIWICIDRKNFKHGMMSLPFVIAFLWFMMTLAATAVIILSLIGLP